MYHISYFTLLEATSLINLVVQLYVSLTDSHLPFSSNIGCSVFVFDCSEALVNIISSYMYIVISKADLSAGCPFIKVPGAERPFFAKDDSMKDCLRICTSFERVRKKFGITGASSI